MLRTARLPDTGESRPDEMKTSVTPRESLSSVSTEAPADAPTDAGDDAENEGTATLVPRAAVTAGRVLGGRYQLDAAIGSGGMGDIYRARRLHIGDTVAVKVLRPEVVDNAQSRQRFYREARAAAMLHHPNAVVIHDFGEDSDGTAYIVMELLEGRNLRHLLVESGTVAPQRAVNIIRQACAALEAAHRGGIVHRDIKPDNIMLLDAHSGVDHVKVLDFGIAKLRDKALDTLSLEKNLTNVGTVIGTPHYMSPEQCQGEPADSRSDIYSLGVVIYEMLTGVTPFVAKTPTGVAIKHVTEPPRPLTEHRPELSPEIEKVVLRALEKEPGARQQSALELAHDLNVALKGDAGSADLSFLPGTPAVAPVPETTLDPAETVQFSTPGGEHTQPVTATTGNPYATQVSGPDATEALRRTTGSNAATPKGTVPVAATTGSPKVKTAGATKQKLPLNLIGIGAAGIIVLALASWLVVRGFGGGEKPIVVPAEPTPAATVDATATVSPSPPTPPTGMAFVPGGEFTLGREDGEPDERPTRMVAVKPFFIDQNEVTNEQYQKFLDETKYPPPPSWKGGHFPQGAETLPVTDVTWEDAMTYARSVGKRLPTEEEWEFAARGTDGRLFPWGNDWQPDHANSKAKANEKRQAQPVGQSPQGDSPFGLHDLSGNAWEWTSSDYVAYPGGFIEPPPAGFSNLKVIRGGSFDSSPKSATTTLRRGWPATRKDWPTPGNARYDQTGFRCAQDAPQP